MNKDYDNKLVLTDDEEYSDTNECTSTHDNHYSNKNICLFSESSVVYGLS